MSSQPQNRGQRSFGHSDIAFQAILQKSERTHTAHLRFDFLWRNYNAGSKSFQLFPLKGVGLVWGFGNALEAPGLGL